MMTWEMRRSPVVRVMMEIEDEDVQKGSRGICAESGSGRDGGRTWLIRPWFAMIETPVAIADCFF